ncbi:septation protein SepH [Leucobacter sp. NPDC058333]|uniref:septation protein SepH n=1 Tax=Leucobacter sp. NPDC058333 TaxID=3346450 RepID=UPI00365D564C
MDELRFVRRDDRTLIVANDAGDEFRFVVDDAALSEMRHLARKERHPGKVGPREIQALIRAGKTRAQVASETGLDDVDIERYEEPVLAERRYILERAHAVPVRTDAHGEGDQTFGAVIAERLIVLGSETNEWASWRDEDRGWMVSLEFISHDVAHRAVWTFDHRKALLSPINPDAVNLSKQGDVGDRLIPKLRAVDSSEQVGRFDSGAFDADGLPAGNASSGDAGEAETHDQATAGDTQREDQIAAPADPNAEFARRREIDQRAISSDADAPADLSQTADLLDALRKRRGERDHGKRQGSEAGAELQPQELDLAALRVDEATDDSPGPSAGATAAPRGDAPSARSAEPRSPQGKSPQAAAPGRATGPSAVTPRSADGEAAPAAPRSIWSTAGVSGTPKQSEARSSEPAVKPVEDAPEPERTPNPKKGRASIPSWDDILFGTRSDEDPSN